MNCPKCDPPKMSSYLEGRLMSESETGGEECVRLLIQAGADVNKRDSYNRTPLMLAAKYGFHKCVKLLLKAGADVNMEDMGGLTALGHAAKFNPDEEKWHPTGDRHRRCIKKLIKAQGVDVNEKTTTTKTLLVMGVEIGDEAVVRALISAGADVNAKNNLGVTALLVAVQKGKEKCIEVLVQNGADVNVAWGQHRSTVLIEAVLNMDLGVEYVKMLIDAGAKMNRVNKNGWSPLMQLVRSVIKGDNPSERSLVRGFTCIKLLLKAGSPINYSYGKGHKIFDYLLCSEGNLMKGPIANLLGAAGETANGYRNTFCC